MGRKMVPFPVFFTASMSVLHIVYPVFALHTFAFCLEPQVSMHSCVVYTDLHPGQTGNSSNNFDEIFKRFKAKYSEDGRHYQYLSTDSFFPLSLNDFSITFRKLKMEFTALSGSACVIWSCSKNTTVQVTRPSLEEPGKAMSSSEGGSSMFSSVASSKQSLAGKSHGSCDTAACANSRNCTSVIITKACRTSVEPLSHCIILYP